MCKNQNAIYLYIKRFSNEFYEEIVFKKHSYLKNILQKNMSLQKLCQYNKYNLTKQ